MQCYRMKGEIMNQRVGRSSIRLAQPVCVIAGASIVGKKEGEGPLGTLFDMVGEDDLFGCKTWEEAESNLQKDAVYMVMEKAGWKAEDVSYLFAGDLLGQCIATSFGISAYNIPLFGVYGACSTCGEALTLGAVMVAGGYAEHVVCVTSSHFASAEKQFRFPLEYANQRPLCTTWTVTGAGAFVLGRDRYTTENRDKNGLEREGHSGRKMIGKKVAYDQKGEGIEKVKEQQKECKGEACCDVCITGITPGKIVDYGVRDSMNMGGCMAPAACDTIARSFSDFGRTPSDYDAVFTGDLGIIGQKILLDLLEEQNIRLSPIHKDCGILIYDNPSQDTHAGGSGCGCSAVVLASYILPKIVSGEWKRILFVPTGALLSKVSFNEGDSIPGIAHGVVIEHMEV